MNRIITFLIAVLLITASACYKDKGNYTYDVPEEPTVNNLDSVYVAYVGDSLVVDPVITTAHGNAHLSYDWRIAVPELGSSINFTGPALRTVFGLSAKRYFGRLTITDNENGMKYFREFVVEGRTAFSQGTTVLSLENGISRLSFIKPDGTVQAHIYEAIHGETLPGGPKQIIPMVHQYIVPVDIRSYWINCTEGNDPAVQIDANTFQQIKTIRENFFDPPVAAKTGLMEGSILATLMGVINGKLYVGTSQTWDQSPVYAMFGLPAEGDYELYEQAAFNQVFPYFLGYEKNRKQFVAFTNFGSPAYIGTGYQVAGTAFDPTNVGLDLQYFMQINSNNCFALGKQPDGTWYELKFGAVFMGIIQLQPIYKRPFIQPALIKPDSKWVSTAAEIFYFTSGSMVYRYNPLNQEVKPLITDFKGKNVRDRKSVV